MSTTEAVLHPEDWTNATFWTSIDNTVVKNIALGGGNLGTAMAVILGSGQAGIIGLSFSDCFFDTASTTTPTITPIDPPAPYVFNNIGPYGRDNMNLTLKMIRRDDFAFDIAVTLNGLAFDLTNSFLRFTAKWRVTDPDGSAVIALSSPSNGIQITNAVSGLATVTIAAALTAPLPSHQVNLPYDIQVYDASGKTYTVLYGTLTVLPDVSRTAP